MSSERISLDDLIDLIAKRNRMKNSIKKKNIGPQVGIFWVILDDLYLDATSIEEAELHGGDFIVHPVGHYEYWEAQLTSTKTPFTEDIRTSGYDYYPRGRVVYSLEQDCFYLYCDKCIGTEMIRLIISLLGLSERNVTVLRDLHYQCSACNQL